MKNLQKVRKIFVLATGVFILALIAGGIDQAPALSRFDNPVVPSSDEPVCYMQLFDGRILNLNNLCVDKSPKEPLSTKDRQFIEEYKGFLRSFPQEQAALSGLVENNPQAIIQRAAAVCQELRTGVVNPSRVSQPDVDSDILNSLATDHYCREFSD